MEWKVYRSWWGKILLQTGRNIQQMWPLRLILAAGAASLLLALIVLGNMRIQDGSFPVAMVYLYGGLMGESNMPVIGGRYGGWDIFQIALLAFPMLLLLMVQGKYLEVALRPYCRMLVPRLGSLRIWWLSLILGQVAVAMVLSALLILLPVGYYALLGMDWGDLIPRWEGMAGLFARIWLCMVMRYVFIMQLQTVVMIPTTNPILGLIIPAGVGVLVVSVPGTWECLPMMGGILCGAYMGWSSLPLAAACSLAWTLLMTGIGWLLVRRRDFLIAAT